MSFERPVGPGAEPPPVPPTSVPEAGITPAMRLQILSTEHWSLLASRSLAWNESFSRGGMFLATLSGAIVALALVAQATSFGEGFRIFGLVILPVVLFVGIGTNFRMGFANYHDAVCVMGMNRIRAAYLQVAPDLEPYFVMGTSDDERGFALTQATMPNTPLIVQMLASSPMLISVLNSVLVGAIAALAVLQLEGGTLAAFGAAVIGFIASILASLQYARRQINAARSGFAPLFPTVAPTQPVDPRTDADHDA